MKKLLSTVVAVVVAVSVIMVLSLCISYGSLTLYRTFAPQWEDARTDVYRNSKSYVEGTVRDL